MGDEKPQAGRHWSKDFVEHLRTVHFTLIAVSVAAIVLAVVRTQSEVSRAHDQVIQIRRLVESDKWDQQLLAHAVPETKSDVCSPACVLEIETPQGTKRLISKFNTTQFVTLSKSVPVRHQVEAAGYWMHQEPAQDELLFPPRSIKDFQELWDSLGFNVNVHTVINLPDQCLVQPTGGRQMQNIHCKWISSSSAVSGDPEITWALAKVSFSPAQEGVATFGYAGSSSPGRDEFDPLLLPIQAFRDTPIDGNQILIDKHPEWRWREGKFEVAFPELAKLSRVYRTSDLKTAEAILDDEERRSQESLDAFGLKFPAETAIRWGAASALILIVQLYLWVHLFEFRQKLCATDDGWNVAWLGVYDTRPARLLLYGSLLIFPLGAVVAVGVRGLYVSDFKWYSWLLLSGTATITLGLSLLIGIALPRKKELVAKEQKSQAAVVSNLTL